MSFNKTPDATKSNHKGKCSYLMMLIKQMNKSVWDRLNPQFQSLQLDDSFTFYQQLIEEYKKLRENNGKDVGVVAVEEETVEKKVVKKTKKKS